MLLDVRTKLSDRDERRVAIKLVSDQFSDHVMEIVSSRFDFYNHIAVRYLILVMAEFEVDKHFSHYNSPLLVNDKPAY
jgi:5-hydroxyisourate hydrolase-like protein (transthyretin family)